MIATAAKHCFSVDDYHRMAEAGILTEDDRVELIEGDILPMSPIGDRHAACVEKLADALRQLLAGEAMVRTQNPILLGDHSEPEPDLVVVRPREDYYASGKPTADDTLLVIEVADATLDYDRRIKLPLYARHHVPEAWLVDLVTNRVEVHRQPTPTGYQQTERFERDQLVASTRFDQLKLAADAILIR